MPEICYGLAKVLLKPVEDKTLVNLALLKCLYENTVCSAFVIVPLFCQFTQSFVCGYFDALVQHVRLTLCMTGFHWIRRGLSHPVGWGEAEAPLSWERRAGGRLQRSAPP